jgi:hypothetical protein
MKASEIPKIRRFPAASKELEFMYYLSKKLFFPKEL